MYGTVLIPVDFKVESLNTLKYVLMNSRGRKLRVILLHACQSDDSMNELLFYSQAKRINEKKSIEFAEALEVLKSRFSSDFKCIDIRLFHGTTTRAFLNFLQAQGIEEICIPANYTLELKGNAFDIMPFINNIDLPVIRVSWNVSSGKSGNQLLNTLYQETNSWT